MPIARSNGAKKCVCSRAVYVGGLCATGEHCFFLLGAFVLASNPELCTYSGVLTYFGFGVFCVCQIELGCRIPRYTFTHL